MLSPCYRRGFFDGSDEWLEALGQLTELLLMHLQIGLPQLTPFTAQVRAREPLDAVGNLSLVPFGGVRFVHQCRRGVLF
jgi:hypothetical protein